MTTPGTRGTSSAFPAFGVAGACPRYQRDVYAWNPPDLPLVRNDSPALGRERNEGKEGVCPFRGHHVPPVPRSAYVVLVQVKTRDWPGPLERQALVEFPSKGEVDKPEAEAREAARISALRAGGRP